MPVHSGTHLQLRKHLCQLLVQLGLHLVDGLRVILLVIIIAVLVAAQAVGAGAVLRVLHRAAAGAPGRRLRSGQRPAGRGACGEGAGNVPLSGS